VAIPEARSSKSRASDSDLEVALKAEKMKVLKNEGNSDHRSTHVSFDNASMIPNLEHFGISFGNVEGNTSQGLLELTRVVQSCSGVANSFDKKKEIMDLEEKELADEKEVDRLLLQNICGEIIDEVMDVGGDDFIIPTRHITKHCAHKKAGKAADWKTVK
jgi:ribosomal protein L32